MCGLGSNSRPRERSVITPKRHQQRPGSLALNSFFLVPKKAAGDTVMVLTLVTENALPTTTKV